MYSNLRRKVIGYIVFTAVIFTVATYLLFGSSYYHNQQNELSGLGEGFDYLGAFLLLFFWVVRTSPILADYLSKLKDFQEQSPYY